MVRPYQLKAVRNAPARGSRPMAAPSILEEKRVGIEPRLGRNNRKLSCGN
jgi:hypothetical protein